MKKKAGLTAKTAKEIRSSNSQLMFTAFFAPVVGSISWAVAMKQYSLPLPGRIAIAVISSLVGASMIFFGILSAMIGGGIVSLTIFLLGCTVNMAPFIYTHFRPLGSKPIK